MAGVRPDTPANSAWSVRWTNRRAQVEKLSANRCCPSAKIVSKASDDLPLPDTPVMTVSRSRGISTSISRRLCVATPVNLIGDAARPGRAASARPTPEAPPVAKRAGGRASRSAAPVSDPAAASIPSGVPAKTTRPPCDPLPGPRSTMRSAARMTSRWCSMAMTVWPFATRPSIAVSSSATSAVCRPVVGSSSR